MPPPLLTTERLLIRDWRPEDAVEAFHVYGTTVVTDWLVPSMPYVTDIEDMHKVLEQWIRERAELPNPLGRWAIVHREQQEIIGGAELRLFPPYEEDVEVAWHLRPESWGYGYATEAVRALIQWAFDHEAVELFAVTHPTNERAKATAARLGMEWVGETTKYYSRPLDVYRVRPGDVR